MNNIRNENGNIIVHTTNNNKRSEQNYAKTI